MVFIVNTVFLKVQEGTLYLEGVTTWNAADNLEDARNATVDAKLNGVTVMSWWCKEGGNDVAGIAYMGTLCSRGGYNTNLNEAHLPAATSAYVS